MISLFNPKSIAVIGASENPEKVGYALMKKLSFFKGNIIPINPNHDKISGKKAYSSVLNYPEKIDLAVIAIPPALVANALEECGKKEIKNAIIISAGFSEIGNTKEEEKIINIAKKYKINLLGPNCFGICNPYLNLDVTFSATTPEKGDIAFISQSGALWSYISDFSIGKFGFSGFASLGNMAGLNFSDFIDYFSKESNTKAIVLYIEKLKDGRKFIDIAKKCKKLIYAVKAGSSRKGSEAAFSHTGSLATDYEIYTGAFKQAGIILCESLRDAFERATCKKLAEKIDFKSLKINGDKKVIIITNAGGAGALVSDYCEKVGLEVIEKPIDLLGTALAQDYSAILSKIEPRKDYDLILVLLTAQNMTEIEKTAEILLNFKKKSGKKIVCFFFGGKLMKKATELLRKEGIICLNND